MVADLSEFLRKVLEINSYDLITVDKELNILGYYSNLLKERFQEDLSIEHDISPHCSHCLLPGLLLQPLVENAVKHGYSMNNKTLEVRLRMYNADGRLHIEVENNGKPVPKEIEKENYGVGLQNVEDRLKAYYKNNYVLTVRNTDYGVLTYIQIPC
jgi:LytS/YehU family sensor histidine kinase